MKTSKSIKYYEESKKIDDIPEIYGKYKGIDWDAEIKKTNKNVYKSKLTQYLRYDFYKKFRWEWYLYSMILSEILEQSSVFRTPARPTNNVPKEIQEIDIKVSAIKKQYSDQLEKLKYTMVEYGHMIITDSIIF